jgi:hypothetical protein
MLGSTVSCLNVTNLLQASLMQVIATVPKVSAILPDSLQTPDVNSELGIGVPKFNIQPFLRVCAPTTWQNYSGMDI